MPKRNRRPSSNQEKRRRSQRSPQDIEEPLQRQFTPPALLKGLIQAETGGWTQAEATRLGDTRFPTAQRQAIAATLGEVGGNRYLQRAVAQRDTLPAEILSHGTQLEGGGGLAEAIQQRVNQPGTLASVQRQEVFDFSDEEGSRIEVPVEDIAGSGAGAGEREVESEIVKLRGWVNLYLSAYRDALNSFSDTMSFASDEEARPRYFDVALKSVGKILLDELINYATTGMPIVGPVVNGAKSVMTDLYNEAQRAQAAQGEARIRDYIVSTRNALTENGGIHRQLLGVMDAARPALLEQYRGAVRLGAAGAPSEAAGQEMIEAQGTAGHLTGEAATFVRDLKAQVEQFKAHVPSAAVFQRRFTEQFADTPGLTAPVSQGGLESGSLHLNMEVYREQEGTGDSAYWSYQIEETESSWRLATSAPQANRLAQSLKDTIGGSVANTTLPKLLHVRLETEVDWGLNDYSHAVIYFRDPASPDFRGWDVNLSRWVWQIPQVQERALSVTNITAEG